MATNLVSQIVEALGPTIVSRIASSLGFDQAVTKSDQCSGAGLTCGAYFAGFQAARRQQLADAVGEPTSRNPVELGRRYWWVWRKGPYR